MSKHLDGEILWVGPSTSPHLANCLAIDMERGGYWGPLGNGILEDSGGFQEFSEQSWKATVTGECAMNSFF